MANHHVATFEVVYSQTKAFRTLNVEEMMSVFEESADALCLEPSAKRQNEIVI